MREGTVSRTLLEWYDTHARDLPWRIGPADRHASQPDPYRVWLSEVMLQQTTVAAVKDYFHRFTTRWPTVSALANADDADVMAEWAGLGYYARARNLLKCARLIAFEYDSVFPQTASELIKLPGIGPYTAAAIASIAFDETATVMDGNVERVMSRLHDEHAPLPNSKPVLFSYAEQHTPTTRPGDYAQAVMDLGATICTPKSPTCAICPLKSVCRAFSAGTETELPKKTPKKPKPTRHGIAYIAIRSDGAVLLETRPNKGLLGGMLGWPTTEWGDAITPAPPIEADWITLNTTVRHTFTHFHLELQVATSNVELETVPSIGRFMTSDVWSPSDLPTVMRKAFDLVQKNRAG